MKRAHSDLEIQLDVSLAGCQCGGQIVQAGRAIVYHHEVPHAIIRLQCLQCGAFGEREYDISQYYSAAGGPLDDTPLNPTESPSELLDIVQFGHLARFYLEYTQNSLFDLERDQARNLLGVASTCIDEAIKHLRGGNQPPPESVFSDDRRILLSSNPQAFTHNNLLDVQEGILQFANRIDEVFRIRDLLTEDHDQNLQLLEKMAKDYKDDPIIFPQIGRIAKELMRHNEEEPEHVHDENCGCKH